MLPSTGIGALSAREAEGRANISSTEKVQMHYCISALLANSVFLKYISHACMVFHLYR